VLGRTGFGQPFRLDEIFVRVAALEIILSNHGYEIALRIGVALDVPLGGLD
jgi:hypothetical protein